MVRYRFMVGHFYGSRRFMVGHFYGSRRFMVLWSPGWRFLSLVGPGSRSRSRHLPRSGLSCRWFHFSWLLAPVHGFRPPGCVYDFRHLDAGHRFHFHGCDGFRLCFLAKKKRRFILCFRGLSAFLVLFLATFMAFLVSFLVPFWLSQSRHVHGSCLPWIHTSRDTGYGSGSDEVGVLALMVSDLHTSRVPGTSYVGSACLWFPPLPVLEVSSWLPIGGFLLPAPMK
jgi:hypothetical protein